MKRIVIIFLAVVFSLFALAGCAESAVNGDNKGTAFDGKVTFVGENGEEVFAEFIEDKELASYTLVRDDNAEKAVIELVVRMRSDIQNKAGAALNIKTNVGGADAKQIILKLDESMGEPEFNITAKNKKIFLNGGSVGALTKAADMFIRNFIRGKESSLLLPAGEVYSYTFDYYFDKLTIEGNDITEFTFYEDESDASTINYNKKIKTLAGRMNEIFSEKLFGRSLEISKAKSKEGKQIIVSSSSLDVNNYSVKIENGNIYLTGSFASVDAAADYLISEVFGYKEGTEVNGAGKTLDVAALSYEGTMGLTVPYTKDELLTLMNTAYERSDMVITGTHTYGDQRNGSGIAGTIANCIKATGESCAIMEIDVGQFGPFNPNHEGEDVMSQYDVSQLVSEGTVHAANGGIMAIVAHLGNPLMNASDGKWYRGSLGNDEIVKEMLTEGTELNAKFRATVEDTVKVVEAFSKNGVPIMIRPFHEINADWFWWTANQGGGRSLSAEAMNDMWKYLYNIVTVERGVDKALWIYSTTFNGAFDVKYAYPGDEYVDLVGIDWYTSGKKEYNAGNSYSDLMSLGKATALTEIGPGDSLAKKRVDGSTYFTYTAVDMLNDIKSMLDEGLKVAYFATWVSRTVYNLDGGIDLMQDPIMYSREDVMAYWAEN